MKQSRRMSLVETVTGTAIGLGVAFTANALLMPAFGYHITAADNVAFTIIFTVISIVRSYVVRRLFENIRQNGAGV